MLKYIKSVWVNRIITIAGYFLLMLLLPINGLTQENRDLLVTKTLNSKGLSQESLTYFEKHVPQPTNRLLIEKGNALYLSGDYKNAANCFFEANKNNSQLANYELARCYAKMNKPDLACNYLTIHLKSKNRNMQSQIKSDQAFADINNSTEWKTLWSADWYSKYDLMYEDARHEHSIGNDNEALTILNKLTEIRKSMVQAHYLKALVYEKLNQPENGLISINLALAKQPEVAEYYYIKSQLELSLNKQKKALSSINEALVFDSTDINYYILRAKINLQLKKQTDAITDIELILSIISDSPTLFLSGQIYAEAGEWQMAIKAYNKCIAMEPYNQKFILARAEAYLITQLYNFAEKDFSFVLDFQPKNGELYFKRANARLGMGKMDEACSDFDKAYNLGYAFADESIKKYCRNYLK